MEEVPADLYSTHVMLLWNTRKTCHVVWCGLVSFFPLSRMDVFFLFHFPRHQHVIVHLFLYLCIYSSIWVLFVLCALRALRLRNTGDGMLNINAGLNAPTHYRGRQTRLTDRQLILPFRCFHSLFILITGRSVPSPCLYFLYLYSNFCVCNCICMFEIVYVCICICMLAFVS